MASKQFLAVETEFNTALSTLGIVQCLFTQEQDSPPTDDAIYWALESVRLGMKRIRDKLLEAE